MDYKGFSRWIRLRAQKWFFMVEDEQGGFSGPVTVFQERLLPERATPAGYAALIDRYALAVLPPRTLSATGAHHRIVERDGWRILTPRHAPNADLEGHLTFALKYEGLDLAVLNRLFRAVGAAAISDFVRRTPTGTYARRIWFLYEWLSGTRLDLPDLKAVLRYLSADEGKPALAEYGGMSGSTVGVLLRKMVELEAQGAGQFFGEPEFDVKDMMHVTSDGRGVVTCLELADVQDRPLLWSTFTMWILAELYHNLPEAGDLPKPKLAFFFDEAHLLFDDASKAFLDQVRQVVRLIRSKGVGVYFVTQGPTDVPSSVLSQLGNRVQHALRAHTPEDESNLRKIVRTFPKSDHYDVGETLTSLGIGEAFVTVLSPQGVPTPLAATRLVPPDSSMDAVDDDTRARLIAAGSLQAKYALAVDRESAHELITARLNGAADTVSAGGQPAGGGSPLPPPPPGTPGPPGTPPPDDRPKPRGRAKVPTKRSPAPDGGLADDVKDIGVGFAKDMLTTADGRRTLRTVFGALFGRR